jgi:hypothetical protein
MFFAAYYVAILYWIDPKLIFFGHGWMLSFEVYVPGMRLFEDVPFAPGAPVSRLAGLLWHYYAISWLGALIITGVAWLLCVLTGRLITAFSSAGWLRWLQFAPALILFAQYSRYSLFLRENLATAAALLLLYLYTRLGKKRALLPAIVFPILTVAIYATAVEAALLFVILAVLFDLFVRRRYLLVIVNLNVAMAIPLVSSMRLVNWPPDVAYIAAIPWREVRQYLASGEWHAIQNPTSFWLVASLVLIPLLAGLDWIVRRTAGRWRRSEPSDATEQVAPGHAQRASLGTIALLVAVAATIWFTGDPVMRASMRLNYFAREKMWADVLTEAHMITDTPYWTPFITHDVNRALFYLHRLPYDMFKFDQSHQLPLLRDQLPVFEGLQLAQSYYRRAELLCEMGFINPAEHVGHSSLELVNYNPTALKLLATVNMVKGLPKAAAIFLRILSIDYVYRDWAEKRLAWLEADVELASVPEIQRLRSLMSVEDRIPSSKGSRVNDELFGALFKKNPMNRMAWEYMLGLLMLNGELQGFTQSLSILDQFEFPEGQIPTHYEEAILVYTAVSGKTLDLRPRRIDAAAIQRFETFRARLLDAAARENVDGENFKQDFGDTYYYYYAFRLQRWEVLLRRPTE